jgi:hypothetical protein
MSADLINVLAGDDTSLLPGIYIYVSVHILLYVSLAVVVYQPK